MKIKLTTLWIWKLALLAILALNIPNMAQAQDEVATYRAWEDPNLPSFAGSTWNSDYTGLRRLDENSRIGEWASPGAAFAERGSMGLHTDMNSFHGRFNNPNAWCQDWERSGDGCIVKDADAFGYEPGKKFGAINTLRPVTGVTDAFNAGVYVDQLSEALTSPLSVLMATINLTEPGIGTGLGQAANYANGAVQNHMSADRAFFDRLKIHPGDGEFILSAYESCMSREQADGVTWLEAESVCMGGERNTALDDARNFNVLDAANPLSFRDDPNHPESPEGKTGYSYYNDDTRYDKNIIRALDYMFNQETRSPSRPGVGSSTDASSVAYQLKKSLEGLRESFELLIGDIEFKLGPAVGYTGDPDSPGDITGDNAGAYSVSVRRILPRASSDSIFDDADIRTDVSSYYYDNKGFTGDNGTSYFRHMVVTRFNDIHALLYLMCRYYNHNGIPGFSGAGATSAAEVATRSGTLLEEMPQFETSTRKRIPNDSRMNFWNDTPGAHQLLVRLSTQGFRMKPRVMDAIFSMFKAEQAQEFAEEWNTAGKVQLHCGDLDTAGGAASDLMSMITGPEIDSARKVAVNTTPRVRAAFAISQRIAFGQFMGTFAKAEDFVNGITGGAYDSLVKRYMLEMIYSAAGTKNIREVLELNNDQSRDAVASVMAEYNENNVESISSVVDSLNDAGNARQASDVQMNRQ